MPSRNCSYDAIIVGAGHNGLTAAALLAGKGLSVLVVESKDFVGGLAANYEPWPGFTAPLGAYVLGLFPRWLMKEAGIEGRIRLVPRDPGMTVLLGEGKAVRIYSNVDRTSREISRFSESDAKRYVEWARVWDLAGRVLEEVYSHPPEPASHLLEEIVRVSRLPVIGGRVEEYLNMASWMLVSPARRILEEWFESWETRSALVEDALVGELAGPSTPGTGVVLAHHYLGVSTGVRGEWAHVKGGMGALSDALAKSVVERGGRIVLGRRVERIVVNGPGEVVGVELNGGEKCFARKGVLWSASVKTLVSALRDHIDRTLRRRIEALDSDGASSKVILGWRGSLKPLKEYSWLGGEIYRSSVVVMPGLEYAERAYGDALYRGISREPWLSINVLTDLDPGLAPEGWNLASIFIQYTRHSSRSWNADDRAEVLDNTLNTISHYLDTRGMREVRAEVLTPRDYSEFGNPGGHIFQLSLKLDQTYFWRPLPELSSYRFSPLKRLYIAGSSAHPGGGVSGLPGYLAARALLEDLGIVKKRRIDPVMIARRLIGGVLGL